MAQDDGLKNSSSQPNSVPPLTTQSFVVAGPIGDPQFQSASFDTSEIDLAEMAFSAPVPPKSFHESPDDLLAAEFQMVHGPLPLRAVSALEELRRAVNDYIITTGDDSVSVVNGGYGGSVRDLRPCLHYLDKDERLIGWMQFCDTSSEAVVVPNFELLEVAGGSGLCWEFSDEERFERFLMGEPRVLLTAGEEGGSVTLFANPECAEEIVEHFLRALRGVPQASFLNFLWRREVERFLGESAGEHERVDHDALVTTCIAHTSWDGGSCIELQVTSRDGESSYLRELVGRDLLQCRLIFPSPESTSWKPPQFEWR